MFRRRVDRAGADCQRACMALREQYLFVCTNRRAEGNEKGSCAARGGEAVQAALKERPKARGLGKVQARVCAASCLDQCAIGVTVLVEPEHFFYARVTLDDIDDIAEALARGERVERLVATAAELALNS